MSVSKRKRYEVFRRDNFTCRYCGARAPETVLQVDHVIPETLGGSDDLSNLVAACVDCNAGKTSSSPEATTVADVEADNLAWRAALDAAREELKAEKKPPPDVEIVDQIWRSWHVTDDPEKRPLPRPQDWQVSVAVWLQRGLDLDMIEEAITIAMNKRGCTDRWRYCCGVAWNMLSELERRAAERYVPSGGEGLRENVEEPGA